MKNEHQQLSTENNSGDWETFKKTATTPLCLSQNKTQTKKDINIDNT